MVQELLTYAISSPDIFGVIPEHLFVHGQGPVLVSLFLYIKQQAVKQLMAFSRDKIKLTFYNILVHLIHFSIWLVE